jgi:hypothetical protein
MSLLPFSLEGVSVAAYSRSTSGISPLCSSGPGVRVTPSLAAYWAVPLGDTDRGEPSLFLVGVGVVTIVFDMLEIVGKVT